MPFLGYIHDIIHKVNLTFWAHNTHWLFCRAYFLLIKNIYTTLNHTLWWKVSGITLIVLNIISISFCRATTIQWTLLRSEVSSSRPGGCMLLNPWGPTPWLMKESSTGKVPIDAHNCDKSIYSWRIENNFFLLIINYIYILCTGIAPLTDKISYFSQTLFADSIINYTHSYIFNA